MFGNILKAFQNLAASINGYAAEFKEAKSIMREFNDSMRGRVEEIKPTGKKQITNDKHTNRLTNGQHVEAGK